MNFNPSKLAEYFKPVSKKALLISIVIGGSLGGFVSLIANACLLEITLNGFFTIYFGIIFVVVGGFMGMTSYKKITQSQNPNSPDQTFMKEEKSYFFFNISLVLMVSGVLILFLERSWTRNLHFIFKVNFHTT